MVLSSETTFLSLFGIELTSVVDVVDVGVTDAGGDSAFLLRESDMLSLTPLDNDSSDSTDTILFSNELALSASPLIRTACSDANDSCLLFKEVDSRSLNIAAFLSFSSIC